MSRIFRVVVSTNKVGCEVETQIEMDDDATEQEIEREAQQTMFEMIEWWFEEVRQ